MGLKRTGNYRAAALYLAIVLGTLAIESVIAIHIITQLTAEPRLWSLAIPAIPLGMFFIFFVLAVKFLLVIYAISRIAQERGLHAAVENDDRGAPLATFQPDTVLALRGGETLTLARTSHTSAARRIFTGLFTMLVITAMGELMMFLLLPAVNPLNFFMSLDSFGTPAPTPLPLDWVSLGYPLAWGLCLFISVFTRLRGRKQRIVADDRGITSSQSGRRQRFIPWNDIVVFARPTNAAVNSPVGSYLLWGRDHGLALAIGERQTQATQTTAAGARQAKADSYDYEGGYEAYEANARRLLATITARSYVPLRTFAGTIALLRGMQRRFPVQTIRLEDVLAAPTADTSFQPHPAIIAAMLQPDNLVTFRARVAVLPALVESLIWSVMFAGGTIGFMALQSAGDPYAHSPWQELQGLPPVAVAGILSIFGLFIVGIGVALAFGRRAGRTPPITADSEGLHTRTQVSSRRSTSMVTLPWGSIRAWGVLPATPGSRRPTTYLAFTDDQKAIWKELAGARLAGRGVRGDRRAAYRERAEELHALIAARTSLPLKVLGTVGVPTGGSGTSAPISPLP